MTRIAFPQKPQPRQALPINILLLVLTIAAVGYSSVRFLLDRSNYSKGNEAYRQVNGSVATDYFDHVINGWRITDIGGYASLAQQEKSDCFAFKPAFDQEQAGEIGSAIVAYKNFIRPLVKVDFSPPHFPLPLIPRGNPMPPILEGEYIQSPPELGDLGGVPGFMQEVYCY